MKIILNGALGHMGAELEKAAAETGCDEIAARVDRCAAGGCYSSISDFTGKADVIIDFSHHGATEELTKFAVSRRIPLVVCTTGQTEDELEIISRAAEKIPVFKSANMSIGVAMLVKLAAETAALFPDADIEIVETHHNRKLDAPSGTALLIANAIKAVRENSFFRIGRSGQQKRAKNEIGIHSLRMGNVVGIHEVHVCTASQTITLKHEAHNRALFAEGALAAAEFLISKPAGLYDMNSLLSDR